MKIISKFKHVGVIALTLGLAVGCAGMGGKPAGASPEAKQAISGAKAALAKAKANHWVWRDTGKILEKAEKAAAEGKNAEAIKMANTAKGQAELAVKQFHFEQGMDRNRTYNALN
jgi:hypothetical protein